jgi:hypothetical protein
MSVKVKLMYAYAVHTRQVNCVKIYIFYDCNLMGYDTVQSYSWLPTI